MWKSKTEEEYVNVGGKTYFHGTKTNYLLGIPIKESTFVSECLPAKQDRPMGFVGSYGTHLIKTNE